MKKTLVFLLFFVACAVSAASGAAAFSDVADDAWYAQSVDYVVSEGLFQGTGADTFSPGNTMTRGMFVTVLGRMAGVSTAFSADGVITRTSVNLREQPTTESAQLAVLNQGDAVAVLGSSDGWYQVKIAGLTGYVRGDLMSAAVNGLADVAYDAYYAPYVSWVYDHGIANGTSATTFSPDLPVTREAICILLSNYCRAFGITLPQTAEKTVFSDESEMQAPDAVYALQQAGIINGRGDGTFDPQASVTRAEVAALFQRYCSLEASVPEPEPEPGEPEEPSPSDEPVAEEPEYTGYELFADVPPETDPAGDSYFDDACFIGHSLVVGMSNFFELPNADYYAVSGISADRLLSYDRFELEETYEDSDGNTVHELGTIADVLAEQEYGKIYIMLGVNELGPEEDHLNMYYSSMSELADLLREQQPDAVIYAIAITPVGRERSLESDNFNRENVIAFNDALQQVCMENGIYYLDAFGVYCDENGYMPAECSSTDGIHILGSCYSLLEDYIRTHTV